MENQQKRSGIGLGLVICAFLGGCALVNSGNNGQVQSYPALAIEAGWIRNGEPLVYNGSKWYPVNDFELLQDADVFQVAAYKGVEVFVEKIAVKPYGRIYTKFDKNKFRYWEPHSND
jgi:hypothetical protein